MFDRFFAFCIYLFTLGMQVMIGMLSRILNPLVSAVLNTSEYRSELHKSIVNSKDINEICSIQGYTIHDHVVKTKDGYLLTIHRLTNDSLYADPFKVRPTVYFHHGLLTNSELFVLGNHKNKCLPFLLADRGYDVWLGNNRGNKYSRKHIEMLSKEERFWKFSLDEYAIFDIPDTLNYILDLTQCEKISYVGFSQGSAIGIASFSLNPTLAKKINLFVGLSPALIPNNLNHPIARFLVNSSDKLLYSIFGYRDMLPSTVIWQKLLGSLNYIKVVDKSLIYLFNWKGLNISASQKEIGYPHMFSSSSVKSVVHWFQIIKHKRFQMFAEEDSITDIFNLEKERSKLCRISPFPIQSLMNLPMLLIYGGSDVLIDIKSTQQNLLSNFNNVEAIERSSYEHMDTLWADDVEKTVFMPIIDRLDKIHTK